MITPREHTVYRFGDVFQINEIEGRNGWIGAFVYATEIKSWGIQGFVHHTDTHEQSSRAYIRLTWDKIEYIGRAALSMTRLPTTYDEITTLFPNLDSVRHFEWLKSRGHSPIREFHNDGSVTVHCQGERSLRFVMLRPVIRQEGNRLERHV